MMNNSTGQWSGMYLRMLSILALISFLVLVSDAQAARSHPLEGHSAMQTFSPNVLYTFRVPTGWLESCWLGRGQQRQLLWR